MSAGVPRPRGAFATLIVLATPMVLARATQSVDMFADAIQVEHLGSGALAAVATGGLNVIGLDILPIGMVFIIQSFVAQLVGRGDRDETPRFAWYGLMLALLAGLFALVLIPFLGPLMSLSEYSPAVRELMIDYMSIRMLSVGAIVGIEALGNWYGGLGNTWMSMVSGVIAMVTNIVVNWLLIDGNLGAPALGVDGAAWSSVIASWLGFGFLAFAFWRRMGGAPKARATGFSLRELRRVIRFGFPNGMNWFLEFAAFQLFVNGVLAGLGDDAVAALNVVLAINSVAFMPAFGLASAGAILAGQAIGAGAREQVWPNVKVTLLTTAVWMMAIGALYLLFPTTLLELFDSKGTSEIVALGGTMLVISAAWQLFDAVAMTLSETLRAAGDTFWTAAARLVLAWAVFVPAAYLVVEYADGGPIGAMICLAGYVALLAFAFVYRFKSGAWKTIELIEPKLI
jgi:MATE family multidrug resistance protein